jgi:hypothetical protein
MTLLIEDWVLYEYQLVGFKGTDAYTGLEFSDCKQEARSLRVVGTKAQLKKTIKGYKIDEVYGYNKEKKGSYWEGICFSDDPTSTKPTLKEYNQKFTDDLERYTKMYKQNKNKVLILRTN